MIQFKMKKSALAVSIVFICFSASLANAETWMEDFYNQAGASMNVTGPGSYQSQSGNVITGGGLSVRIPPKNIQLYNFNPPNLKMGCGGIDLWAGSFGFINKAQFVAFLRNIGQNALGFFFELALKTMAPEIHGVIKGLQDAAQKMNNNSLNACETTKRMFSDNVPELSEGAGFEERAKSFATALGNVGDRLSAIDTYAPNLKKTIDDLKNVKLTNPTAIINSGGQEQKPIGDYNLVQRVLTASGPSIFSDDEVNLIMSLTGTIIVKTPTTNTDPNEIIETHIPPTITHLTDFIGNRTTLTSYKLNECGNPGACLYFLNPTKNVKSFAYIAHEKITAIRDKIRDAQAQDATVVQYLEQSTIPIYRLLAAATRPQREDISQNIVDTYSDTVAVDMTSRFIKSILAEVLRKTDTLTPSSSEEDKLKEFKKHLITLQGEADLLLQEKQMQLAEKANNIQVIEQYDRALNRALGDGIMANLAFK